ncbi:MAG: zf-HC2 domain-containing protein [Mojavia pulchra JT2-VF2]|jgi:anti-sigma factor RsiW|uniref:Zf-HC2 domain-containing protein n=1 Tax=Mojavia pulchra JT2-VF2 TaxID=287848 RepID=A0A951Q2B0_9NOST|nr:zf-HC2 domain-containing protein [Mojavia pulchra JT2-VF2]
MTTDSQFYDRSHVQLSRNLPDGMANHTNESTGAMDMVKRDRFELLSAYLDGEVTAAERRQVEEWLANDASVQCLYARLLKLRQGLRTMPVPATQQPIETTLQQVLARLNRSSQLAWAFGGAAIAACVIGTVSGILPGGESRTLQLAQQRIEPIQAKSEPTVPASPLMVALNNPVIEIPKAAVASPTKPATRENPKQGHIEQDIN